MRILHLSDTHLDRRDAPEGPGSDAARSLRLLLAELRYVRDLDVIVVSGDIADDGSVEGYTAVRGLVGEFAAERGLPVVYSTGNHDERQSFAKVLGSGHVGVDGGDLAAFVIPSGEGERAAVSVVGGYRVVTLDSLVPGKGYGHLSAAQLGWLRELLAVPGAEHGTVLVFHHPPFSLDSELQRALGLRNPGELAEVIRGTDVRAVLCGHFHLQLSGFLGGAPVWVTPGVVSRVDLTAVPGTERALLGPSASLVQLGGEQGPLFHTLHARDPRWGETVYEIGEEKVRDVIARLGPSPIEPI
ncbi:Calcineurin-like phosphoesterase superfamily domain containing protein [Actinobacteria bacterium OK074]|nr:Calcineurin-like phosphoesterase superfamily domain containing protein [Actinobacteria bacterium OK074]